MFAMVHKLRKTKTDIYAYGLFRNLHSASWTHCSVLFLINLISLVQLHYFIKKKTCLRKTVFWQVSEMFPSAG